MLGSSRNILMNAENSVAAPVPTVPAKSSCSIAASGAESRIRDTNSQERGDWECVVVPVKHAEQFRAKTKEGDDLWPDAILNGPF